VPVSSRPETQALSHANDLNGVPGAASRSLDVASVQFLGRLSRRKVGKLSKDRSEAFREVGRGLLIEFFATPWRLPALLWCGD
jgi:hypothetical protein